jgi:hypothetical protein
MIKDMDIATFEVSPSAVTVWNGSFLFFEWGTTPEHANSPSLSTTASQIVTVVGWRAALVGIASGQCPAKFSATRTATKMRKAKM